MLTVAEHITPSAAEAHQAAASAARAIAAADANQAGLRKATARREAFNAEAAELAPSAIASAATPHERDLIARIFGAIPNVLALSQAHSEADAFDKDTVDRKWEDWEAARGEVETLARELLDFPPETASDALRRLRLHRQVLSLTEGAPQGDGLDGLLDEDAQFMGSAAIAALEALAGREPDRTEWVAGLAALAAAEAAYAEHDKVCDQLDAAVTALAPAEIIRPAGGDDQARLKWCGLLNFERTHEPEEAALRPSVEAFFARADVIEAVDRKDEAYRHCSDLLDAISDAEQALARLPAPDLQAVLWKQDRYGLLTDDARLGYADPVRVAAIRDGYMPDSWPLFIHEDVLRLTGTPSPLLTRHPFQPRRWVKAFKAAGGTANLDREQTPSEARITTPFNDENTAEALRLLEDLNEGDHRAVLLAWLREVY